MTKDEMVSIIEENIDRLRKKSFNVYFFVLDTKGNPSSALEYIYKNAMVLHEMGFNVTMLHQEKDFVGVGDWLGEKYANLKHLDCELATLSASDFLFIPEIFANVMMQTKNTPAKKVILVQNYQHITEFLPVSHSLGLLNIHDVIATTEMQAKKIFEYFPYVNTHIVHPSISKIFKRDDNKPQKPIINVICKNQSTINRIVKPFYWKNEIYKWITFRDLRGLSQEMFAECLRESAITIWIDDDTSFGYTLLEALRSGGFVLAKVPEKPSEWMLKDGKLSEDIFWFDDVDSLPDMLSTIIRSWTLDKISSDVYECEKKFDDLYSEENQKDEIMKVYGSLFDRRLVDLEEALANVKNNNVIE